MGAGVRAIKREISVALQRDLKTGDIWVNLKQHTTIKGVVPLRLRCALKEQIQQLGARAHRPTAHMYAEVVAALVVILCTFEYERTGYIPERLVIEAQISHVPVEVWSSSTRPVIKSPAHLMQGASQMVRKCDYQSEVRLSQ